MKDFLKVVISGGPCAGKTTALDIVAKALDEEGDTVIIVDETATELIRAGIRPFGKDKDRLELINFQREIITNQIDKEDRRLESARKVPNDEVTILYDRGAMDGGAYLTDEEFAQLLKEEGYTEEQLLDRYDLIIILMSTAVDKEKCYVNSAERIETPVVARQRDIRTAQMWHKHPNLIVINNDGTVEEKVELVLDVIRYFKIYKQILENRDDDMQSFPDWVRDIIRIKNSPKVYKKK